MHEVQAREADENVACLVRLDADGALGIAATHHWGRVRVLSQRLRNAGSCHLLPKPGSLVAED